MKKKLESGNWIIGVFVILLMAIGIFGSFCLCALCLMLLYNGLVVPILGFNPVGIYESAGALLALFVTLYAYGKLSGGPVA